MKDQNLIRIFQIMKIFKENSGRNNHNASKLIEKYSNLAREALSGGDKILSENYFQHADHFTRVLSEQEIFRKSKFSGNSENSKIDNKEQEIKTVDKNLDQKLEETEKDSKI